MRCTCQSGLPRAAVDGEEVVGAVGEVERLAAEDGLARHLGAAVEAPDELPVGRVHRVERAVVRAEVDDVELRVVERLALHGAERLEAPDGAAVARPQRVEAVVARADEDAAVLRDRSPARPRSYGSPDGARRRGQLAPEEDVDARRSGGGTRAACPG